MYDNDPKFPRMLKPDDVASRLNVSRSLVYELIERRKLPCHRIGVGRGAIRVAEDDVVEFLRATRTESGESTNDNQPMPRRQRLRHLRHPK